MMNQKKNKIQKLLDVLSGADKKTLKGFEDFDIGAKKLKDDLLKTVRVSTLDDVNDKLGELKSSLSIDPLIKSVNTLREDFYNTLEQMSNEMDKVIAEQSNTISEKEKGSMEKMSGHEAKMSKIHDDLMSLLDEKTIELGNLRSEFNSTLSKSLDDVKGQVIEVIGRVDKSDSELKTISKDLSDKISITRNEADQNVSKTRIELISIINNKKGGGNMNRQINVKSSVMSVKYTDINFANSGGIEWTASDDETNKRVNITASIISAGSGGSSVAAAGNNTEIQYNDGGSFGASSTLTWNKNSSVFTIGNSVNPSVFHVNGPSSIMTFQGNVGIGITAPTAKLHIDASGANTTPLIIKTNGSAGNYTPSNSGLFIYDAAGTEIFRLFSSDPNSGNYNSQNLYFGKEAGFSNPTNNTNAGYYNIAVGTEAMRANTTGNTNAAFGSFSLWANTIGSGNTGFGYNTLGKNISGNFNMALGLDAIAWSETGSNNTAVGAQVGRGVSGNSYSNNALFGYRAGFALTTGSNNLLYGYRAGDNLTTGSGNILIGYDIETISATVSSQMSIGNLIFGTGIDGTGTAISSGNIGIGNRTPNAKLDIGLPGSILGTLRLEGSVAGYIQLQPASTAGSWTMTLPPGTGSANQVLTTDGNGITAWASVASGGSGITRSTSIITANTTGGNTALTDYVYHTNEGITFTLPTAISNTNLYTVKMYAASSVLIATSNGQTIDGSDTALITQQYQSLSFISNNSVWGVI